MIPQTPMQQWIAQHMSIFEELINAVTVAAKSAGDAGRNLDKHGIKESAWTPIKYPDAIWDENKGLSCHECGWLPV